MKQGIVIGTGKGREDWFNNLMDSIKTTYKIYPVYRDDFELGVIGEIYYKTDLDEFLFLHDTTEIKDNKLFDISFKTYEGKSVALSDHPAIFGMYLGKYRRSILSKMKIPQIKTKLEAVDYEEYFNIEYSRKDGDVRIIEPPLRDNDVFIDKFGKKVMKLENKWLIKYKSTWSRSMI